MNPIFCPKCKLVRLIDNSEENAGFRYCQRCGTEMEDIDTINNIKVSGFLNWLRVE